MENLMWPELPFVKYCFSWPKNTNSYTDKVQLREVQMEDESSFTLRAVDWYALDIKHMSDVALHLEGWQKRALPGEPSGPVPYFREIGPSQKSLLRQQSFVRVSKIRESTCDGSANGAAPAVPQLSYSEMKGGRVTLSLRSGLFILEDETPTKRLTSRNPFSAPTHLQTSLPGITSSRLQGQRLSCVVSLPLLPGEKQVSFYWEDKRLAAVVCNQVAAPVGPECPDSFSAISQIRRLFTSTAQAFPGSHQDWRLQRWITARLKQKNKRHLCRSSLSLLFSASPNTSDPNQHPRSKTCLSNQICLFEDEIYKAAVRARALSNAWLSKSCLSPSRKSADHDLWDKEPTCFSYTDHFYRYYCRVYRSHRTYKSRALASRWRSEEACGLELTVIKNRLQYGPLPSSFSSIFRTFTSRHKQSHQPAATVAPGGLHIRLSLFPRKDAVQSGKVASFAPGFSEHFRQGNQK